MRFIIGDIHLGLIYDDVDRSDDIKTNLEYIKKTIVNKVLECGTYGDEVEIILLGDIFDSPNVSFIHIKWFIDYLNNFYTGLDHKFKFLILKGNHDGEADSKKGTPIQVIESKGLAHVIYNPTRIGDDLFIPYCTQEELNAFKLDFVPKLTFTHCDLEGIIKGVEQKISRGSPVVISKDFQAKCPIMICGHIHEVSSYENKIFIIGSILFTDLSEKNNKCFISTENGTFSTYSIPNRKLLRYDINYQTQEGQSLYNSLVSINNQYIEEMKDSIVTINFIIPYALASQIDLVSFKNLIKSRCYHLRLFTDFVKEKQVRIKELSPNLSDRDIFVKYLESQGINNKELLIQDFEELLKCQ